MRLLRLELRDVRCHSQLEVDFPPEGILGIIGANESGKSSILEAVGWALYGVTAIRGTAQTLGRRGGGPPHVKLDIEIDDVQVVISRRPGHAEVRADGRTLASGTTPVNDYVVKVIGMTWGEFAASYFAVQGHIKQLLTMRPASRGAFVRRLLGVDRVDEAVVDLRREKLAPAKVKIEHLQAADLDVDQARSVEQAASKAVDELDGVEAAIQRKSEVVQVWRDNALAETKDLARLVDQHKTELEAAEREVRAFHDHRERWQRSARARKAAEARVASLASATPDSVTAATGYRLGAQQAYRELEDEWQKAKARTTQAISQAREDLQTAKSARYDACAECGRPWDQGAINAAREKLEAAYKADRDVAGVPEKLVFAREHAERADREWRELRQQATRLADARRHLSDISDGAEPTGDIQALTDAARQAREQYKKTADARMLADKEHADAVAKLDRLVSKKSEVERKLSRLRTEQALVQARRKRIEKRLEELEACRRELATAATAVERITTFRNSIAGRIRPELEELASGFVGLLTDGRHEAVTLDESLHPTVWEDGQESDVISGGTEDVVGLSMRLALGELLAARTGKPIEFLLLDEPFGSLDAVRRANVMELLARLRGVYRQIVLISHVEETRDAVDKAVVL